jgi:hypothetical protein
MRRSSWIVVAAACTLVTACERELECAAQSDCRADELCSFSLGDGCGQTGSTGFCQARPVVCAGTFDPVCGCDGRSYENACSALSSGISIAQRGLCGGETNADGGVDADVVRDGDTHEEGGSDPSLIACSAALSCPEGWYCNYGRDVGGQGCGAAGVCMPQPTECAESDRPQCSCGDRIQDNLCWALRTYHAITDNSECTVRTCTPDGSHGSCESDEYCHVGKGDLADRCAGNVLGECRKRPYPELCQRLPDAPVCTCSGRSFRNACEAYSEREGVIADGLCEDPRYTCSYTLGCPQGSLCNCGLRCGPRPLLATCSRDTWGRCEVVPTECEDEPMQTVCGCDLRDYPSSCHALRAGRIVLDTLSCALRPCSHASDCVETEFCDLSPEIGGSGCGSATPTGFCRPLLPTCTVPDADQCGC